MRTAIYVRVSTLQQAQSQTIDQQLERLQAHCQTQQWPWQQGHIFRDEGYSGASLRRPGLDRLRDQVSSGCFDHILITEPSRLARKYVHQMLLIEEFQGAGCQVHFIDRPMSQDPNDQLLLQIRGAVAEYERTLITERMRRGRQHKYRAGVMLPWTRPPYGYHLDPDHPRNPAGVRVDAAEGAMVSELFALYVQPGQSLTSLSTYLKQLQVPSPTGKQRWSTATLRRILTNPVYMGVVYAGRGQVHPSKRRRSALAPVGQRATTALPTSPEQWILVGHIPALVTQDGFEQVQAKLKTNQQFARRNNRAHTYLLRALVSCGCCQLACTGQTRKRYSYYICVGKSHPSCSGREQKCHNRLIPMKQLDEVVWADLCDVLSHPEAIQQAVERAQSGQWLPQELQGRGEALRKAKVSVSHQIDRLTDAYLEQIVSLEEYGRRRRELEERQEAITAQVRQLEARIDHQVELTVIAQGIESFCQRVQQGLAQATFEQKRHLVELLIDRVVVTQENVEIRYVIPTSPRGENSRFYQLRIDYCRKISPHAWPSMFGGPPAADVGAGLGGYRDLSGSLQPRAAQSGAFVWQPTT